MSIQIKTKGIDAIIETLERWSAKMPDILENVVDVLAVEGQQVARNRAPVDTGFLRDSINIHYEGPAHQRIVSEAGYSGFQEFGFNHYRDGFIAGRFYMTGALGHIGALITESTIVRDIISAGLRSEIVPPSTDS